MVSGSTGDSVVVLLPLEENLGCLGIKARGLKSATHHFVGKGLSGVSYFTQHSCSSCLNNLSITVTNRLRGKTRDVTPVRIKGLLSRSQAMFIFYLKFKI